MSTVRGPLLAFSQWEDSVSNTAPSSDLGVFLCYTVLHCAVIMYTVMSALQCNYLYITR